MPHLAHVTLVVREYDEALAYYVGALGFTLVEDTPQDGKRWVTVRPPATPGIGAGQGTNILLARAATPEQQAAIGAQTGGAGGGRVAFFLATDDFARDHAAFTAAGVDWVRAPVHEPYGIVAVFRDLYGNLWDLIERDAR